MPTNCCIAVLAGLTLLIFPLAVGAEDLWDRKIETPEKYILDYPQAQQCCPPIRSTFFEAQRNISVVRGRRFRHQPNGGFGLPVVDKVNGKNLLHLGADLGWLQVNEPVFAIADGVVRGSDGPDAKRGDRTRTGGPGDLSWGNFVVIEHRFDDDQYFTTVYGHLGADRRVKIGDVVSAGQQIGTIGPRHSLINGNYTPHLHFGVREGRKAELGAALFQFVSGDGPVEISLAALSEESIELQIPSDFRLPFRMMINGHPFQIQMRDGKAITEARLVWLIERPDFAIVGYDLSKDHWRDPIAFLREHNADTHPAPYRLRRLKAR